MLIARDILETGALYSVASQDIPGFERYLAQLKSYYLDYKIDLPESPYKYQLLGLNLLSLLSQNRYVTLFGHGVAKSVVHSCALLVYS